MLQECLMRTLYLHLGLKWVLNNEIKVGSYRGNKIYEDVASGISIVKTGK